MEQTHREIIDDLIDVIRFLEIQNEGYLAKCLQLAKKLYKNSSDNIRV